MTILVTGGAGYIGSHAVRALRDHGYRVVCLTDACQAETPERHEAALECFQGYSSQIAVADFEAALMTEPMAG